VVAAAGVRRAVVAAAGVRRAVVAAAGVRRAVVAAAGVRRAVVAAAGARRAVVAAAGARRAVVAAAGARRAVVAAAGARPAAVAAAEVVGRGSGGSDDAPIRARPRLEVARSLRHEYAAPCLTARSASPRHQPSQGTAPPVRRARCQDRLSSLRARRRHRRRSPGRGRHVAPLRTAAARCWCQDDRVACRRGRLAGGIVGCSAAGD
jgi:hypothetical protein